jgi:hypothetical protein
VVTLESCSVRTITRDDITHARVLHTI